MPLPQAARIVIDARLRVVLSRLPHATDDPVAVRKLRVSLRRAAVALRAFEPILPSSARRLRRRLNRIRRTAGRLRDCDLHLDLLAEFASGPQNAAALALANRIKRKRVRRCKRLARLIRRKSRSIEERAALLLEWLESDAASRKALAAAGTSNLTLNDHAGAELLKLLCEIHSAAEGDLTVPDRLHEVRIACRRLRYAIELFECTLPPVFRSEFYPRLIEIQDRIGRSADLFTLRRRLERRIERLCTRSGASPLPDDLEMLLERVRQAHEQAAASAIEYLRARGLRDLEEIERELKRSRDD